VYRSLHAGARGYIVKSDSAQEYIRIIEAVLADAIGLSSGVEVLQNASGPRITPREAEVLDLVHDGWVHDVIAIKLNMKKTTVRTHVENVRDRFNLRIRDKDELSEFLRSGRWLAHVDWTSDRETLLDA
jgi:DNA-binding NarL/FixJ family response regulator